MQQVDLARGQLPSPPHPHLESSKLPVPSQEALGGTFPQLLAFQLPL